MERTKIRCVTSAVAVVSAFLTLAGCASDYAKLDGFHDPGLEQGSTVMPNTTQQSLFGSKDIWTEEFRLSAKGLGKVHVRQPNMPAFPAQDKPGYYKVTVNAGSAKNLKWEVWASASEAQIGGRFGSTALHFQKILGPFSAGELVKLDYLETTMAVGVRAYIPRHPLIVVYSPSEPGASYSLELHKGT